MAQEMAQEWLSGVVFAVGSACLLLQAFVLARLLRSLQPKVVVRSLRQRLLDLAGWLQSYWTQQEELNDDASRLLTELTRQKVDVKRVTYARWCLTCAAIAICPVVLGILWRIVRAGSLELSEMRGSLSTMLVCLIASVLLAVPSLINTRSLNLLHIIFSSLLTWTAWYWQGFGGRSIVSAVSILVGCINLDLRVSLVTNTICLAVLLDTTPRETPGRPIALVIQVGLFVVRVGLLLCLELALVRTTRQQLEVNSERGHKAAVSSLLGMLCDSVVELNDQLNMVEHCPALASALFHGPGRSLRGQPLKRLMCSEEEQEYFESTLHGQDPAVREAHMFHTTLRDSWGKAVPMQVFQVPFASLDGREHHLVGLREDSGDPAATAGAAAAAPEQETAGTEEGHPVMPTIPEIPGARLADGVAAGLVAESGRLAGQPRPSRSRSSGSSPQAPDANDVDALQVDVKVNSELTVKFASTSFMAMFGVKPSAAFAELIPEPAEFVQWLSSIADEMFSGARVSCIEKFGRLTIVSAGPSGSGSGEQWRVMVQFPGPFELCSIHPDTRRQERSEYVVAIMLEKPRRTGADIAATAERQAAAESRPPTGRPPRASSSRRSSRSGSSRSRSSRSSRQARANGAEAPQVDNAEELQIDVTVDSQLRVRLASTSFVANFGTPPTFAELLPEPAEFVQWLNSIADEVFSGARPPQIEDFGSLTIVSAGPTGCGSGDRWRVVATFPSPFDGASSSSAPARQERSSYSVSLRLEKPLRTSSGTAAVAERQALRPSVVGRVSL